MADRRRLTTVPPPRVEHPIDPRVTMVREVLEGSSPVEVAARWAVDVELLRRWVSTFVAAGGAAVVNRPEQNAAEERDRFLSAFAHELRTPLTAVQVWVELLTDEEQPPQVVSRGLVALRGAVSRLAARIVDVELLAAASLGRLTLHEERVSLLELASPLPAGADVRIGADSSHAMVDPAMFRLILRDLWQAASMPPAPRALRLETEAYGLWTEIRVVREAEPIDHAVLTALFEPFGDQNLNGDGIGVTIGLYLARALTVAHGGTMGCDQDDDRLVFWVRVPNG